MRRVLLLCVVGTSAVAVGAEETYVFESKEDPSTPPDASVCAAAPFTTTVRLGASLWSIDTRKHDASVRDGHRRRIGRATACLALTNVLFPEGLTQQFYARFDLPSGSYTAIGTCTVSSNSVPQPFIILAGCTLKLLTGPQGSLGGMVTSSSIFNPLQRPGFGTGSVWTLHEFSSGPMCRNPHDEDD